MGIRWESIYEYSGNMGTRLGFRDGQDRIQFTSNLNVKVSRSSTPCLVAVTFSPMLLSVRWADRNYKHTCATKTRRPRETLCTAPGFLDTREC